MVQRGRSQECSRRLGRCLPKLAKHDRRNIRHMAPQQGGNVLGPKRDHLLHQIRIVVEGTQRFSNPNHSRSCQNGPEKLVADFADVPLPVLNHKRALTN